MANGKEASALLKKVGDKSPKFSKVVGNDVAVTSGPLFLMQGKDVFFGCAQQYVVNMDAHHIQAKKGDIVYVDQDWTPVKPDYFLELSDLKTHFLPKAEPVKPDETVK